MPELFKNKEELFNGKQEYKEVSVNDIIDAMERNGFAQARSAWVNFNKDESVHSACAMGQAAINLGIDYSHMSDMLSIKTPGLKLSIMDWNDRAKLSCQVIARQVRETFPHYLDKKFEVHTRSYKIREKKSV